MAFQERQAQVTWAGTLTEGGGTLSVGTGALPPLPVTWAARTETPNGVTSPEELIAAAQAACYAMALSHALGQANLPPDHLTVTAVCSLERPPEGGLKITAMDIDVHGRVPGADPARFERIAQEAEKGCPVSNALRGNLDIRVTARLDS